MPEPIFLYDDPTLDFHDAVCPCGRCCRNCGYILEGRQRKYCSDYCGRVWRREVEFDRMFRQAPTAP